MSRQENQIGKTVKKGSTSTAKVKKGRVIDRRHNRTLSQDVARGTPKWKNVGTFDKPLLERIGKAHTKNYIYRGKGNRWESANQKVIAHRLHLAPATVPSPKMTPAEAMVFTSTYAKVDKL